MSVNSKPRALTSLNQDELDSLLIIIDNLVRDKGSKNKVGGLGI